MVFPRKIVALCACLAVQMIGQAVFAQTLELAPVSVDVPAGRMTSTIRITNRGDQPTTVQIRSFAWSQSDGDEHLDPTPNLLVSPPFATLGAGETQTVRVVLRKAATAREDSYRLLVDQLPSAATPGSINVALRVSLPVFAAPALQARAALSWKLVGQEGGNREPGKARLVVRNDGTRRARLSALTVEGGSMTVSIPGFAFRYVLAGAEAVIPVEIRTAGPAGAVRSVHVSATTDQGKVEADAPVTLAP